MYVSFITISAFLNQYFSAFNGLILIFHALIMSSKPHFVFQTLHFMYAYTEKLPSIRGLMNENKDDFPAMETAFKNALRNAWNAFVNLVG